MNAEFVLRSHADNALFASEIRKQIEQGHVVYAEFTTEKTRTQQQQKALEVYFKELAKALNDAGWDQRKVMAAMREGVEIPWAQESVKDVIWRMIQKAVTDKKSTTELDPSEVSKVYDIVNRFTSERFGVSVLFPDRFTGG